MDYNNFANIAKSKAKYRLHFISKSQTYYLHLAPIMEVVIRKGKKEDCAQFLKLIQELADYERAPNEVAITLQELEEDGFGSKPIYNSFVAVQYGKVIGMALFYEKYSTWKGRSIYLEDLIVTKEKRGLGAGKALFEAVIKVAKEKNCGRMEWQILDWNTPAIDFYKTYGAELDSEWINGKFRREQLENIKLSF